MRKLAAILLLSIFTFNMVGYQLVYNYFTIQSDAALELALDTKNYSDAELITIKQPANLPYYTNNNQFQRIDGEITINGTTYKYVQCRIYNDSLEMRCIPNKGKMQIEQSKNEYAKLAHDFQQGDNKEKKSSTSLNQMNEYEELPSFCLPVMINEICSFISFNNPVESKLYFTTEEQPPDTVIV